MLALLSQIMEKVMANLIWKNTVYDLSETRQNGIRSFDKNNVKYVCNVIDVAKCQCEILYAAYLNRISFSFVKFVAPHFMYIY